MEKDFEITVEPVYGYADGLHVKVKYLKNNYCVYYMAGVFIRSTRTLDRTVEIFICGIQSCINEISNSSSRYDRMSLEDRAGADIFYEVIKTMPSDEFIKLLKPSLIDPINTIFQRKTNKLSRTVGKIMNLFSD
jgi:hypothetical protein